MRARAPKSARVALPRHLFTTADGQRYTQDDRGRVYVYGVLVSRAPLAAFAVPRLDLRSDLRADERAALLFLRTRSDGMDALVHLTGPVSLLALPRPVTTAGNLAPEWLDLARALLLTVEPTTYGATAGHARMPT